MSSFKELPKEIIYGIASLLRFRALVRVTETCHKYNKLLQHTLQTKKTELFAQHTHMYDDDGCAFKFVPAPAIPTKEFPEGFPITGIYFFEDYEWHSRGDINFFFSGSGFSKFLKERNNPNEYVATIHTKTKKIHQHELGCVANYYKNPSPGHWNDADGDFRAIFHFGKTKMKEFWRSL